MERITCTRLLRVTYCEEDIESLKLRYIRLIDPTERDWLLRILRKQDRPMYSGEAEVQILICLSSNVVPGYSRDESWCTHLQSLVTITVSCVSSAERE